MYCSFMAGNFRVVLAMKRDAPPSTRMRPGILLKAMDASGVSAGKGEQ